MFTYIKKYCYISTPVFVLIAFLVLDYYKILEYINLNNDDIGTLIGIIGTLIGFLLTAMTIFLSLPKDTIVMIRVKKYNHHKIFANCIISGIIFSCLTIVIWIFKLNSSYILLSFALSMSETIMAAYYTYIFCLYSFE